MLGEAPGDSLLEHVPCMGCVGRLALHGQHRPPPHPPLCSVGRQRGGILVGFAPRELRPELRPVAPDVAQKALGATRGATWAQVLGDSGRNLPADSRGPNSAFE